MIQITTKFREWKPGETTTSLGVDPETETNYATEIAKAIAAKCSGAVTVTVKLDISVMTIAKEAKRG